MTTQSEPPVDREIIDAVDRRGITEVMHFTTRSGLVGILAQRSLQARDHLSRDQYLEHIYTPNANFRREASEYWRYVNLSITRPNERFFGISRGWHANEPDLYWAVLSFSPEILSHDAALFSTTNMMHGVVPVSGVAGFESLFAPVVNDGHWCRRIRPQGLAVNLPTDPQAELLYPDRLSTRYLQRIYVTDDEHAASVEGIVGSVDHDEIEVLVTPELFGR